MQKQLKNDEQAQVGIGTMIVFIATILVAAVAAGVLIDTSQKLSDKSVRTGNDATENVGTSLEVLRIYGVRDLLDDGDADGDVDNCAGVCGGPPVYDGSDSVPAEALDYIKVQLRLAAGATSIDINDLIVQFDDGTSSGFKTFVEGDVSNGLNNGKTEFLVNWLSWNGVAADNILAAGEIVELQFGDVDLTRMDDPDGPGPLDDLDMDIDIGTSQVIELKFLPEVGQAVKVAFTTPVTFGNQKVFDLF